MFANIKLAKMTVSHWCVVCEAKNELTFSISKLENNKYRISTHGFKSNGENLNKKLRLKSDNEGEENGA